MALLDRYLTKLGVTDFLQLNAEERETYRKIETSLNGRKITDEDVRAFFQNETEEVLSKLPEQRLGSKDDTFLKVYLKFLRNVERFLNAPAVEKKMMEAQIARQVESIP